jgi:carbonic anhydrase
MSADELLDNNRAYAARFDKADLAKAPARKLAVVTCMDARVDVHQILGLDAGDAHVIRNAGGVATEDAIRSLAISQRLLGTEEIFVIYHTDCGMVGFEDRDFRARLEDETGVRPEWAAQGFPDPETGVRESVARIEASPFLPRRDSVRGFVYEVETGRLREVG